jgi:hypothetical protein
VRGAYDSNHAVRLEQGVEVLQELEGEEGDRLGAASKDIVNDVVIAGFALVRGHPRGVGSRVFNDGGVVARELEVLGGKLVNHRVEFDHSRVNAVGHKGSRRGANTETTGESQHVYVGVSLQRLTSQGP